jgi:cell wall-associated NlpC family hydrolase
MTRYRRRRRYGRTFRRMYRRMSRRERQGLAVAVVAVLAIGMTSAAHGSSSPAAAGAPPGAAGRIIAYAQAQEGCPYVYGGTGPCDDGWDCSGLVQAAYASAGISIARTSEEQWAEGPQVSSPQPGDLVFFTGDPIDPPPGHVAIYVSPGQIIDAYATGTNVQQQSFGQTSSWPGLGTVYGYTDPMEGS